MTVIAADFHAKVMVADSCTVMGQAKWRSKKIERVRDSLVGCAGDCGNIERFLVWFRAGCVGKKPKIKGDEFEALELDDENLWLWDDKLERFPVGAPRHAVGSGAVAALAAFELKCDAVKAVRIACAVTDGCEPPIQIKRLKRKR